MQLQSKNFHHKIVKLHLQRNTTGIDLALPGGIWSLYLVLLCPQLRFNIKFNHVLLYFVFGDTKNNAMLQSNCCIVTVYIVCCCISSLETQKTMLCYRVIAV